MERHGLDVDGFSSYAGMGWMDRWNRHLDVGGCVCLSTSLSMFLPLSSFLSGTSR